MGLNLVIAGLIAAAPLRRHIEAIVAEHASIWQPLPGADALRALLAQAPVPDVVIADHAAADLNPLRDGQALVWLGDEPVPAGAVRLAPDLVSARTLTRAIVTAVNLARTTRLLHGLEPPGPERTDTDPWSGFDVHFQPQWSIDGQHLTAAEALLRWHGLEVATLRPDAFVAAAEAQGNAAQLGDWIIIEACTQAARWLAHWPESMVLSLNVTASQLATPAFAELAREVTGSMGLDPVLVDFELSAHELLPLATQHAERLHELGDQGFGFTLDRIGSALFDPELLKLLPLRTLKVDRGLVRRIADDVAAHALIEQLAELGHRLGIACVAVGVETDAQRALLAAAGYDALQGFLFSDALSGDEFGALLAAQRERRRKP